MNLSFRPYQLPFVRPLKNSKREFLNREGIIISYTSEGHTWYSEAAPLPGYSRETLEEVEQKLAALAQNLEKILASKNPVAEIQELYREQNIPSSLQFGLDALAYQLKARAGGKTLHKFLFPNAPPKIRLNALGSLLSEKWLAETQAFISKGYRTLKFKIGVDFEKELARLQQLRSIYPDLTIRLDANRAWSLNEAQTHCKKLSPINVEYCEEPLRKPTPRNYEVLNKNCELPLALDESLLQKQYWPNLLPFTSYIILKPMLLGNFSRIFETKRLADTLGNKVVFTSSLESGIGRYVTAILATGLGSPKTAHGLATGTLLAQDIYDDSSVIKKGEYHLKGQLPDALNTTIKIH